MVVYNYNKKGYQMSEIKCVVCKSVATLAINAYGLTPVCNEMAECYDVVQAGDMWASYPLVELELTAELLADFAHRASLDWN